jgi:hypothetical protein
MMTVRRIVCAAFSGALSVSLALTLLMASTRGGSVFVASLGNSATDMRGDTGGNSSRGDSRSNGRDTSRDKKDAGKDGGDKGPSGGSKSAEGPSKTGKA